MKALAPSPVTVGQFVSDGNSYIADARFTGLIHQMESPRIIVDQCRSETHVAAADLPGKVVMTWRDATDRETVTLLQIDGILLRIRWHFQDVAMAFAYDECDLRHEDDGGWEKVFDAVHKSVRSAFPPVKPAPKGTIDVGFWYMGGNGPAYRPRKLSASPWSEIEGNYSADARDALATLTKMTPDAMPTNGRLILFHGPAGSGKTTMIRALADAWEGWCDFDYVVDPDAMFASAGYLMEVLTSSSKPNRWRCIVVEDAEEFLVPEAKSRVGQSVARLLNLSDGMIGQGLKILVLMTSNAQSDKMHEAIQRPGRCLATIHVPPLTAKEAKEWLGGTAASEPLTLAELYERKRLDQITAQKPEVEVPGTYL